MQLLSSLNSGFLAAANGTAEIYIRGTSTRATTYADFEGNGTDSSGADIPLDAYGSALVYVNQLVDVVVKDEDGNEVRSYGDGYAAPNIEARTLAFNGTDYVTAAVAPGNPTNLKSILDLWLTNSGAVDWQVLIGGVATTLQNAFGTTTGMWFNVKSPAYGAVGDGVTNDQTAIGAALAAAIAAGGGTVFFPLGTYLISTAIEWDHRVSIVGMGADLSVLTTNSGANARLLTWTAGTAQDTPQLISGMSFAATQANTGNELYATVAVNIAIRNCYFGASTSATGTLVNFTAASNRVLIAGCRFDMNGAANTPMALTATTQFWISDSRFFATNTAWSASLLAVTGKGFITNCVFDVTAVTAAGTLYGIENLANTDRIAIYGCSFPQSAQTYVACLKLLANSYIIADGLDFDVTSAVNVYLASGTLEQGSRLQLRGSYRAASSAAPTIPDGVLVFEMSSTTTVPTFTMPTGLFPGQELIVLVLNGSGAGWGAMTFTGAVVTTNVVTPSVANTSSGYVRFVLSDLTAAGTFVWRATDANG